MAPELKAHGIILRVRPYSETSLIVHWLTKEAGLQHTLAKGARRSNSAMRGKIDIFFEADFSMHHRPEAGLHYLKELLPTETHPHLRNINALSHMAYASMLIEQNVERETPVSTLFSLLQHHIQALRIGPPTPWRLLAFEWKFLEESGLAPQLETTRLTPGSKAILAHASANTLALAAHLRPNRGQTQELAGFLGFLAQEGGLRLPPSRQKLAGS